MLLLVDISKWNVFVDYSLLAARSDGAFIKATEGRNVLDKHISFDSGFNTHWEETKKVNLPRGAYHYWDPEDDPKQQAKFFFDTVNATGDLGEFPPVLDVEEPGSGSKAKICIQEIEQLFQRMPILYTRPGSFAPPVPPRVVPQPSRKEKGKKGKKGKGKKEKGRGKKSAVPQKVPISEGLSGDLSWGKKYPLWVAHYLTDDLDPTVEGKQLIPWSDDLIERWVVPNLGRFPLVPGTFLNLGWKIWQFSQIGNGADWGQDPVNSIQIDLDVFEGPMEELAGLGGVTVSTGGEEEKEVVQPAPSPSAGEVGTGIIASDPMVGKRFRVTVNRLNVRSAPEVVPGSPGNIKDKMPRGDTAVITDVVERGGFTWFETGYKQFIAFKEPGGGTNAEVLES